MVYQLHHLITNVNTRLCRRGRHAKASIIRLDFLEDAVYSLFELFYLVLSMAVFHFCPISMFLGKAVQDFKISLCGQTGGPSCHLYISHLLLRSFQKENVKARNKLTGDPKHLMVG